MSKHHRYSKHTPQLVVSAPEHFILQAVNHAERAGGKLGYKIAKKELKNAQHEGLELSEQQTDELLQAAERAGAAAALAAARRVLGKSVHGRQDIYPGENSEHKTPRPELTEPTPLSHGMGQHVLTVKRVKHLSSEMIRVIAGADRLAGFRPNGKADQYVKVYFADRELGLTAPYDLKALRHRLPREQVPRSRSYTIRWVDRSAEELAIDFVVHGDRGYGSSWAAKVLPGDPLVISDPRGKFTPSSKAGNYLFAADEAGIPAVSVALSMLRADAQGIALLEVAGAASEFEIEHPAGIELRWLHRDGLRPGTSDLLPPALLALGQPNPGTSVMAHAERSTAKAISNITAQWGLNKKYVHVSSYWTLRR
ncbi:MAG: siderophore-interacting protein [Glutamicibacter sp.]|uniref:siderophore-interacting protein n=1 Tax=Glutamicibacter sp. BW80 TaxID=2024404 RepID=UPI001143CA50|nr:siderophore-interacting protein [Glutamicibacter sp. BW80]